MTEVSLSEKQRRHCEKYKLDYAEIANITPLLHDLLDNIRDDINTQIILRDTAAKIILKLADWHSINKLITSKKTKLTPKQKSILELFLYLNLVEGIYSETVNTLIILLIRGGIEFSKDLGRTPFSTRYLELRKMHLSVRTKFLEKHGFKPVANAIDRNLRNCIAHLNYFVEDDGSVTNKTTDNPIVANLARENKRLGAFCSAIFMVIMDRFRPVKEGTVLPKNDLS
jgi:hypothetical protein